jgi:hypothetical protein
VVVELQLVLKSEIPTCTTCNPLSLLLIAAQEEALPELLRIMAAKIRI